MVNLGSKDIELIITCVENNFNAFCNMQNYCKNDIEKNNEIKNKIAILLFKLREMKKCQYCINETCEKCEKIDNDFE